MGESNNNLQLKYVKYLRKTGIGRKAVVQSKKVNVYNDLNWYEDIKMGKCKSFKDRIFVFQYLHIKNVILVFRDENKIPNSKP